MSKSVPLNLYPNIEVADNIPTHLAKIDMKGLDIELKKLIMEKLDNRKLVYVKFEEHEYKNKFYHLGKIKASDDYFHFDPADSTMPERVDYNNLEGIIYEAHSLCLPKDMDKDIGRQIKERLDY